MANTIAATQKCPNQGCRCWIKPMGIRLHARACDKRNIDERVEFSNTHPQYLQKRAAAQLNVRGKLLPLPEVEELTGREDEEFTDRIVTFNGHFALMTVKRVTPEQVADMFFKNIMLVASKEG
jgi:hypothetical protein